MQSLWMLFATFTFSIMGVCIKLASDSYSTAEIVMYRGLIGVIFIFGVMLYHNDTIMTRYPLQHLWRGVIGVTAMWFWFYSIAKLPLATAMTLNYMSPIWMAAILFISALWQGKKRLEWGLVLAISMGFAGVILLLRPSINSEQWFGGIIGLISGFAAALAYLQVRHLGLLGETESRVVFYLSATGMIAGLLGIIYNAVGDGTGWHAHNLKGIVLLLTIGITAAIAQIAMTRAYQLGKTLVTANLQYTGIVFSSIWGVLIWSDLLDRLSWLGIFVIFISGILATFANFRQTTSDPPASHKPDPETDPITKEL